ncbi:retrovirus-related pol polyprotein from transposon TNT 1-94 [Tanacetum coccineum]
MKRGTLRYGNAKQETPTPRSWVLSLELVHPQGGRTYQWKGNSPCSQCVKVKIKVLEGLKLNVTTDGDVKNQRIEKKLDIAGTLEKEGFSWNSAVGKFKVINGFQVVLSGTRRDNLSDKSCNGLHKKTEEKSFEGGTTGAGQEQAVYFGNETSSKPDYCEKLVGSGEISHESRFSVGRHTTPRSGRLMIKESDLWGPSQDEYIVSKRYFLSIIDDYSRRVWVYILRFKHEAFGKFKEWKQLVENQTGRTVKKVDVTIMVANSVHRESPSTSIENKTPMVERSGHPSDYERIMRRFLAVSHNPHNKQVKARAEKSLKAFILGGIPSGCEVTPDRTDFYRLGIDKRKDKNETFEKFRDEVIWTAYAGKLHDEKKEKYGFSGGRTRPGNLVDPPLGKSWQRLVARGFTQRAVMITMKYYPPLDVKIDILLHGNHEESALHEAATNDRTKKQARPDKAYALRYTGNVLFVSLKQLYNTWRLFTTIRGGLYGSYGGFCEGSYLARGDSLEEIGRKGSINTDGS